jgi:predicted alpha-1,2-mannosidase
LGFKNILLYLCTLTGFVPQDDDHIATSLTLSYAFDDWSVAQVANYLGKTDDASTFRARALAAYPKIWNSKHELMCPLYLNGNSNCSSVPFTPYPFEDNYVEGSALQWLWFVPHDPAGLVGLFPTNSSFVHKLTNFFVDSLSPEQGGKWPYANVLANGWYWAGNEPDLLTPWLFAYAGAQYRTANWTRWLNNNLYTVAPDGVPGNDDFGTMSSWYVWAALGIYPQAGSTRFIIGSPRWNAYIAQRNLTVNVINGGQQNLYVQQASVNGRVLTDPFLEFSDLVDSVVTFTMGALPR